MSANSERPFSTLSAFSAPASTPRKFEAANGSRMTGTFAVDGLLGPEHLDRAVDRLIGDRLPRKVVEPARDREGEPRLGLVALDREGHGDDPRVGARVLERRRPSVEAIATRDTASPTCARSSFVTRGSRETV